MWGWGVGEVWAGSKVVIECDAMRCERGKRGGWVDFVIIVLYYLSYVGEETYAFYMPFISLCYSLSAQVDLSTVAGELRTDKHIRLESAIGAWIEHRWQKVNTHPSPPKGCLSMTFSGLVQRR